MIRAWGLVVVTLLGLIPRPASAQDDDAGAVHAATAVVMRQLEAFRRDDFDAAYTFASSVIHDLFDRPAFERMVRDRYPEIARSRSAVVDGGQLVPNGHVVLLVTVHGANGRAVQAIYELVPEDDGWRVNAVVAGPGQPGARRGLRGGSAAA